jgi:hypothetical protein
MTVPDEADRVLTALRLGWSIAEVRGRNRPDAQPGAGAGLPGPPCRALPLHVEQTPTELRIEAQAVLAAMARQLGVDSGGAHQAGYPQAIDALAEALARAREGAPPVVAVAAADGAAPGGAPAPAGGAAADGVAPAGAPAPDGAAVPDVAAVLDVAAPVAVAAHAPAAGDPAAQWAALQELIFKFDAHIQDALALGPDTVACGYQLGRALAEPYWALDPALDTDNSPAAWQFLLGSSRCSEIARLAGRLGAYLNPYTAAAVAGSVQIWKHVAADKAWRSHRRRLPLPADAHLV